MVGFTDEHHTQLYGAEGDTWRLVWTFFVHSSRDKDVFPGRWTQQLAPLSYVGNIVTITSREQGFICHGQLQKLSYLLVVTSLRKPSEKKLLNL